MKVRLFILFAWFAALLPRVGLAQDNTTSHQVHIVIPEVARIALVSEEGAQVFFHPFSDREAGSSLLFDGQLTNRSFWLNYTSIKKSTSHTRTISAYLKQALPAGINLMVTAMPAEGSGKGQLGTSVGTVLLTESPEVILSDIGSCYTGKGVGNGHNLVYALEVDESKLAYEKLQQMQLSLDVVYTISE